MSLVSPIASAIKGIFENSGQGPIQSALRVLRKYGSDAHAYIPGGSISTYGPELVVNGGFGADSSWTKNAGWSINVANGNAVRVPDAASTTLAQNLTLTVGATYRVTYSIVSISAGAITARLSGGTTVAGTARSTVGEFTEHLVSATGNTRIELYASTVTNAVIDNISVKEVLTTNSVVLNGMTAGNYTDTAGTQFTTNDQPVGLDLDAMGSFGGDLKTTGYTVMTGTSTPATYDTVTGIGSATRVDGSNSSGVLIPITGSKTIAVVITNTGSIGINLRKTSIGSTVVAAIAAGTTSVQNIGSYTSVVAITAQVAGTATFTVHSVKEVTGIHATQGTAGNKPILRQGLVNLLTYSNDLTNTAWNASAGITKAAGVITETAISAGHTIYRLTAWPAAAQATFAAVVSAGTCSKVHLNNSGAQVAACFDLATGTVEGNIGAIVGSIEPLGGGQFLITATHTAATAQTASIGMYVTFSGTYNGTIAYLGTSRTLNIHSIGMFLGALTPAQILAAGGIPLTTSAKASAGTGPSYWEFGGDGTPTDYLGLGSVPFQMSDDFVIVTSIKSDINDATWRSVFTVSGAGNTPRIQIFVESGVLKAFFRSDAGVSVSLTSSVNIGGASAVICLLKIGTNVFLRVGGVQIASGSVSTLGASTFTGSDIGRLFNGSDYFGGNIFGVFPVKGTITDADLLLIEKLAANLAGITI